MINLLVFQEGAINETEMLHSPKKQQPQNTPHPISCPTYKLSWQPNNPSALSRVNLLLTINTRWVLYPNCRLPHKHAVQMVDVHISSKRLMVFSGRLRQDWVHEGSQGEVIGNVSAYRYSLYSFPYMLVIRRTQMGFNWCEIQFSSIQFI